MADNEKLYAKWVDIPNPQSPSTLQRTWLRDEEAQAALAGIPSTYATKQELEDAQVASMFRLFVDPADMHLKGRNVAGGTFEVVNGHLIMHQTQ